MAELTNPDKARNVLRGLIVLFAAVIGIPVLMLVSMLEDSLKVEAARKMKNEVDRVFFDIAKNIQVALKAEENRPVDEYSFFNVARNDVFINNSTLSFSPLSSISSEDRFSGSIGYFQINPDGSIQTPLLPELGDTAALLAELGIAKVELSRRLALESNVKKSVNRQSKLRKVSKGGRGRRPSKIQQVEIPNQSFQASFNNSLQVDTVPSQITQQQGTNFISSNNNAPQQQFVINEIDAYEAKVEPFQVDFLGEDTFVFSRDVIRGNQKYVQGFVVSSLHLYNRFVKPVFYNSSLSEYTDLRIDYDGITQLTYSRTSPETFKRTWEKTDLKYMLSEPFEQFELAFTVNNLNLGDSDC